MACLVGKRRGLAPALLRPAAESGGGVDPEILAVAKLGVFAFLNSDVLKSVSN